MVSFELLRDGFLTVAAETVVVPIAGMTAGEVKDRDNTKISNNCFSFFICKSPSTDKFYNFIIIEVFEKTINFI